MSDVQLLFAIFLGLCILQSVRLVPADVFILHRTIIGQWRLVSPSFRIRSGQFSIAWLTPWSFPGFALAVRPVPFSISPDGFLPSPASDRLTTGAATTGVIRSSDLPRLEAIEEHLYWGDTRLLTLLHPPHATELASRLGQLSMNSPEASAILHSWFDELGCREAFDSFMRTSRLVRYCAVVFFLALVAFFLLWDRLGLYHAGWALLPALICWPVCLVSTWQLQRDQMHLSRAARWLTLFEGIFYPISIIRVADALSLPLLECRHPVAGAIAVDEPTLAAEISRRELREYTYPLRLEPTPDALTTTVRAFTLDHSMKELIALLGRNDIEPGPLLNSDDAGLPNSLFYCPRCLTGYAEFKQECGDCPGVSLKKSVAGES